MTTRDDLTTLKGSDRSDYVRLLLVNRRIFIRKVNQRKPKRIFVPVKGFGSSTLRQWRTLWPVAYKEWIEKLSTDNSDGSGTHVRQIEHREGFLFVDRKSRLYRTHKDALSQSISYIGISDLSTLSNEDIKAIEKGTSGVLYLDVN